MEETVKNLAKAFVGESQARNRYTFYAKTAKNEGFEQISAVFLETADQEKEHAKVLFKLINELGGKSGETGGIVVDAPVPAAFGTTAENLKAAAAGEKHEYSIMYPEFAEIAAKEGLAEVSQKLKSIAKAEAHHEERYLKLLAQLGVGATFKRKTKATWVCRNCGFVHEGESAPENCPACSHPQSFFQIKSENY